MSEIIEQLATKIPDRNQIDRLQEEISKMPQADGMITDHFFADGMYSRRVFRKAGTLATIANQSTKAGILRDYADEKEFGYYNLTVLKNRTSYNEKNIKTNRISSI